MTTLVMLVHLQCNASNHIRRTNCFGKLAMMILMMGYDDDEDDDGGGSGDDDADDDVHT